MSNRQLYTLDEALALLKAQGYRVTKPKAQKVSDETNPFGHAFPHAKLINVTLTPISRLLRPYSERLRQHLTR